MSGEKLGASEPAVPEFMSAVEFYSQNIAPGLMCSISGEMSPDMRVMSYSKAMRFAEAYAAARDSARQGNGPVAELISVRIKGKGRHEEFACLPGYQPPEGTEVVSRTPLYTQHPPSEPVIPLCAEHAQSWFTERNLLATDNCVVCAHERG